MSLSYYGKNSTKTSWIQIMISITNEIELLAASQTFHASKNS